jgi:hypothetical protein
MDNQQRHLKNKENSYLKNCPRLTVKECSEINFDFTEDTYKNIQNMLESYPGLTAIEYANKADFYNFTENSITHAFKLFNTWKQTYYNKCGPFICKDNRWFPVYSKKYINTIKLATENSVLRSRIKKLEIQLSTKVFSKNYSN